MSERQEVEVLIPLERVPTRFENRQLLHLAFAEAKRLVAPHRGKVLGLKSVARASIADGHLAMRTRFEVLVPEAAVKAARQ
jgi:hypothetical protein